jgi:hypothetical protein
MLPLSGKDPEHLGGEIAQPYLICKRDLIGADTMKQNADGIELLHFKRLHEPQSEGIQRVPFGLFRIKQVCIMLQGGCIPRTTFGNLLRRCEDGREKKRGGGVRGCTREGSSLSVSTTFVIRCEYRGVEVCAAAADDDDGDDASFNDGHETGKKSKALGTQLPRSHRPHFSFSRSAAERMSEASECNQASRAMTFVATVKV